MTVSIVVVLYLGPTYLKQKIMMMRVLIEKTIEEDIYRKNYNPDVVVSFEEQNYIVEPTKPKIVVPEKDGQLETESETSVDVLNEVQTETTSVKPKPKKSTKKSPADIEV
jgi:hypothetical protein